MKLLLGTQSLREVFVAIKQNFGLRKRKDKKKDISQPYKILFFELKSIYYADGMQKSGVKFFYFEWKMIYLWEANF